MDKDGNNPDLGAAGSPARSNKAADCQLASERPHPWVYLPHGITQDAQSTPLASQLLPLPQDCVQLFSPNPHVALAQLLSPSVDIGLSLGRVPPAPAPDVSSWTRIQQQNSSEPLFKTDTADTPRWRGPFRATFGELFGPITYKSAESSYEKRVQTAGQDHNATASYQTVQVSKSRKRFASDSKPRVQRRLCG
jgi:hypothetical protein